MKKTVQFSGFSLDLTTGELRKHGIRVRLQDKSFQILEALIERPGEVVSREELQKRLWPDDTYVDFESGLNTAVNRLRLSLRDSADKPAYVETVARKGYRFIGSLIEPEPPRAPVVTIEPPPRQAEVTEIRRPWLAPAVLAAGVLIAFAIWISRPRETPPAFRQITFRPGIVLAARFAPDGESIVYSANWNKEGRRLYLTNTRSPESRALDYLPANVLSISPTSELAMVFFDHDQGGSLVRTPINGGSPLKIAPDVYGAEWMPDGQSLIVQRQTSQESTIEYPIGKALYKTAGGISDVRASPRGDAIAFFEHPVRTDDAGYLKILTLDGKVKTLGGFWASANGVAWSPSGEIWFTACPSGGVRSVFAATRAGTIRKVASIPGNLRLFDISRTGKVLIAVNNNRMMVRGASGDEPERDLSWFDWSRAVDLSRDGSLMLFDETGEGGGPNHGVYIRNLREDRVTRLGDGEAMALSPDLRWAIAMDPRDTTKLTFLPIGPGQPRTISGGGLIYSRVQFFPDRQRLLVAGNFPGKPMRFFVQAANGGAVSPIGQNMYLDYAMLSPDGTRIAGVNADHKLVLLPVDGGGCEELGFTFPSRPLRWTAEEGLLIENFSLRPPRIERYNVARHEAKPWRQIAPDALHLAFVQSIVASADGKTFAYNYAQTLSELFVADGWK